MIDRRKAIAVGAAAGVTALFSARGSAANPLAGKSITLVVPFASGSAPDEWARGLTAGLSRHIAGNPTINVRNQPGGGSVAGANLYAATARPDGLSLLVTSPGTLFPYLLGEARVMYDFREWSPLIVAPGGGVAYIAARKGLKGLEDLGGLKGQKLYYASQGVTSLDLVPLLAFHMLGLEVQHVTGLAGRSEARMAFERGETNIDMQPSSAYLLGKRSDGIPLFSWGVLHEGAIVRDAHFGELPHVAEAYEIVHGRKPAGPQWEALRAFILAGFASQRMLLMPRSTPEVIADAYRKAASSMLKDLEQAGRQESTVGSYEMVAGEAAEMRFRSGISISPAGRDWARGLLSRYHNVSFDRPLSSPTP